MGIFHELKTIVNRAPIALNARFDGQDMTLPPGESQIPSIAINHAKNQNPIMGSQDPNNPSLSGARYLVGIKGQDDCTPLTKEEWEDHTGRPCRLDWQELLGERLSEKQLAKVVIGGKAKKTQATGSYDAGVRVGSPVHNSDNA